MPSLKSHKAWLTFLRKVISVPLGYSKEDLWEFVNTAQRESPSLVPIIEGYLRLAEESATNVEPRIKSTPDKKHLFDLLRDKKFFPQNSDLADFAGRVVPGISTYRFDKMSRGDIAARVIEYLESEPNTRARLERSMRDAFEQLRGQPARDVDRRSFLSTWENIIKGIHL